MPKGQFVRRTPEGKRAQRIYLEDGFEAYTHTTWYARLRLEFLHGECRGCLDSDAEVFFHLDYDEIGREKRQHIIPVCQRCHDRLTYECRCLQPYGSLQQALKRFKYAWVLLFRSSIKSAVPAKDVRPEFTKRRRKARRKRELKAQREKAKQKALEESRTWHKGPVKPGAFYGQLARQKAREEARAAE